MYPHERSLVKRLEGEPFAIVGVNSDVDKEELRKALEEERITWRSFWNGPLGPAGTISTAWNVQGWPTLFVIDHEGVIRHTWTGSPEPEVLDAAIEELVAAARKADTGGG